MQKKITWVLVANDKKAKILLNEGKGSGLTPIFIEELVAKLVKAEAAAGEAETESFFQKLFGGGKSSKPVIRQVNSLEVLITDVINLMNRAAKRGMYDKLYIVGEKSAVAKIMDGLSPLADSQVEGQLNRDLMNADEYEVNKALKYVISL